MTFQIGDTVRIKNGQANGADHNHGDVGKIISKHDMEDAFLVEVNATCYYHNPCNLHLVKRPIENQPQASPATVKVAKEASKDRLFRVVDSTREVKKSLLEIEAILVQSLFTDVMTGEGVAKILQFAYLAQLNIDKIRSEFSA